MLSRFFHWSPNDPKWVQNIDLYILFLVAIAFSVLGITGIAESQAVSAATVALLAVMAWSQLKSRDQISSVSASWKRSRTDLFLTKFPRQYYEARERATHSYFFAGTSMARTLPTMQRDIERILNNNGSIKILLPDPDDDRLIEMITAGRTRNSQDIRRSILNSLEYAANMQQGWESNLEIRTTNVLPKLGINAIDIKQPAATIMIQMYGFRPLGEPAPIFTLTRDDTYWFKAFSQEIERLWDSGHVWR